MIKLTTAPLLAALFVLPAFWTPAGAADPAAKPTANDMKSDDGLRNPTPTNGTKPDKGLPAAKPAADGMKSDDGLRNPTSKPDDGMRTDSPKTR
jgi:hypothetical protein